ncbi:conserved hypothetical protein [Culex quinquefasciatus]|uniref:Uncharacterized protein n=1 Tax=Culex quinquefasciatus TaxID=7176 RepID=B0W9H1_CULQU|nr:conserved hypothetical protein [Culex quinquefasciatus]|eukprot:XP_001845355.1 conserved hypothetical protein [Culex quinquefasciatus]
MDGVVCPIFKKDYKLDYGITLINAAYKILSQILCRLLTPYTEKNISILEKCREYNVSTHHIIIDFKAVY